MTDFLNSLKADLLDRRLRPVLIVAGVALLGAIAYVAFAGGSGSSTPAPAASASAPVPSGIATSVNAPNTAVAETTEGEHEQHHGVARNPFAQQPAAARAAAAEIKKASAAGTSSAASGSGSSSSSAGSSTSEKSSTTSESSSSTTTTSKQPAKPKAVYDVEVLFGLAPPPPPAASTPLTPYKDLKLSQALPSAKAPLIVYRGVTSGGKSATFTLVSEAILHGAGACLPNPTQCQSIDLRPGQVEQLEYLNGEGALTVYELSVVTIAKKSTSSASAASLLHSSKAGTELLRHDGLVAIPGLRASSQAGVLVFARAGSHR